MPKNSNKITGNPPEKEEDSLGCTLWNQTTSKKVTILNKINNAQVRCFTIP